MRGLLRWSIAAAALGITGLVHAIPNPPAISTAPAPLKLEPAPEPPEPDQPFSADEGEAKAGELLTPNAAYTSKKPYDQARDALQKAVELWKQKQMLKTSDMALEAYDDLMEVHLSRRQKKARRQLSAERHLAAQIYVDSSIAFIKQDAVKKGSTPAARQEARDRLGDLHDVSREYLELQKQVVNAIMELQ